MWKGVVLALWLGALQSSVVKAHLHLSDTINGFHTKVAFQGSSLRQDMTLSEYIWNEAVDLLPKAWNTTFIAGVANGNMNPDFYGNYVLQDATYCRIVAQLWTQLANNVTAPYNEVSEYASGMISSFNSCSTWLFDGWNVKDDGENNYGVIVRQPVEDYVTFINDTMLAKPPNMLIATYACLQLWHNLTTELLNIVNSTNPYAVWVNENHGNGTSARRQAAKMDEWDEQYGWYDRSEARNLFRCAVMNEINFFEHGGNSSDPFDCAVENEINSFEHGANSSPSLALHTIEHSKHFLLKEDAYESV